MQPFDGVRYPLVPFCVHLTSDGVRDARAYRYDLARDAYEVVAEGLLESAAGAPWFRPAAAAVPLRAGDRVVPVVPYRDSGDEFVAQHDNAGGVAAVAAPVLAAAGVDALLAFPDEEEGAIGPGNQMIGRGGMRIVNLLPVPDLADSDEVSRRFRPKPATCSEASQPGIPMEAGRGGGAV